MIQNPGLCAWTFRTCLSKYMRLGTINEHSGQTLIFPGSMSYLLRTVYDNCHLPSIFLNSMCCACAKLQAVLAPALTAALSLSTFQWRVALYWKICLLMNSLCSCHPIESLRKFWTTFKAIPLTEKRFFL